MSIAYVSASTTVPATNESLYIVPQGVAYSKVLFGICNNITTDTTLSLYVVPEGGIAGSTNQLITTRTVSTSTPDFLDAITGMILETGESIVVVAANASRLNIRLSIMEVSE